LRIKKIKIKKRGEIKIIKMNFLSYVYLSYMFISLYFLLTYLLIFLRNRKDLFAYPKAEKQPTVSFIVPAWNEEKTIRNTLEHILNIDYKKLIEVIVINDCSTDNTRKIVESLLKKNPRLKLINNKTNLGKAGGLNIGLKIAKGELIAVVDADSYPAKDSIKKMIGFFNNEKIGAVTCLITARNKNSFFEKLQSIEYKVIAFTRKLLGYVGAIYVTPGPLALYRKKALEEAKGFDEKNMTEDIEITWNLISKGWERAMCLSTEVTTTIPKRFKDWFVQRRRWNIGGLQCILKYKKSLMRRGIFGFFIIPVFLLGLFLGLFGLSIFFYLFIRRVISNFLRVKYSIIAETPILSLNELYITPSFLNYLGGVLFLFGFIFTLIVLKILNERILKKENILNIPFYMIIYIAAYPLIMINSLWHIMLGKISWR